MWLQFLNKKYFKFDGTVLLHPKCINLFFLRKSLGKTQWEIKREEQDCVKTNLDPSSVCTESLGFKITN